VKLRNLVVTAAIGLSLAACGTGTATTAPSTAAQPSAPAMSHDTMSAQPSMGPSEGPMMTDSAAADLRTKLDVLLGEHLILASKATDAALGGRTDAFNAYGTLLNTNGTDIGAMIGAAYGDAAKDQFNQIWSAHNGFFVDYTTGVATKDQAKMDKAVQDLTTVYVPAFAQFLAGATDLPVDALTSLTTEHVLTTKAVVDAQGKGDQMAAAAADRMAAQHMEMIADPLAAAIVAKLPDKF
jgi:hypothetical protein